MFEVIKAAIENGGYRLEEMLSRVRAFAAKGLIGVEEMAELEQLARDHADVRADTDVFSKLEELEQRVRALESGSAAAQESDYVPGRWYYRGDRCRENGVNYVCIAPEGKVCTWPPSEYPVYWEEIR